MSQELTITLLDKSLTVACPPGQAGALLESADILNKQMLKVQAQKPTLSLLNIALLSALNISHQLLTHSTSIEASSESIEKLCHAVSQAIES